jgi:YVTN family beta-propeller protein
MPRCPQRYPAVMILALALAISACAGGAADPGTLVVLPHAPSGEVRFLQFGSGRVTDRVRIGGEPHHLVRDAARGRVYVADRAGDSVVVVDVVAPRELKRITVGREPHFVALSPDGRRLYATVAAENVLAIIDAETLTLTARVPVGNRPLGLAVSGDGSRVYVANEGDDTIVAVDPIAQRRVFRPIPVPAGVSGGITLSTDGATLLSGTVGRSTISAVAIASRTVRDVPLGDAGTTTDAPHTLFATPDGRFWLVGHAGSEDVVAVPAGGGQPVTIRVGEQASSFAVAPGGRVLVASVNGEYLVELDLEKGKVTRRIRVGLGHADIAVFSRSALEALRGQ